MRLEEFNQKRNSLNKLMSDSDPFFKTFGEIDDKVYSDNAIPKKYKELTGLSISVSSRCDECILYHIQGCVAEEATKQEIIEAIKLGVIAGGSVTYPSAKLAFEVMREMNIIG